MWILPPVLAALKKKMANHVCNISPQRRLWTQILCISALCERSAKFVFLFFFSHWLTTRFWCLWLAMLKLSEEGELQHVVKAHSFSSTVIPWLLNCETRQTVSTGRKSVQQLLEATLNKRRLRSHILPQSHTDESIEPVAWTWTRIYTASFNTAVFYSWTFVCFSTVSLWMKNKTKTETNINQHFCTKVSSIYDVKQIISPVFPTSLIPLSLHKPAHCCCKWLMFKSSDRWQELKKISG